MPYWRLSNFYFFYFALLGATAPFLPLYFEYLGFNAARIGELVAVPMLMRCLAPNLWGWLGDKTGQRLRIVRWGALLTLVGFSLIFFGHSYAWLALVMLLHAFFWHAILPQFEVLTFSHLQQQVQRYTQIRLWGSVGFIVTVVGMGYAFELHGMGVYPVAVVLVMSGIWLSSLLVPDAPERARDTQQTQSSGFLHYLQQRTLWVFYLVVMLMQVSHGPYYTFLSKYLADLGYSKGVIGWFWSLGVVAEIIMFIYMPKLLLWLSLRQVLLISLILAALRWLALGQLADQLVFLLLIQLLHAATFGSFHAGCMQFIQSRFAYGWQGQGQALYVSLYGVGAAIGALYAGYAWELLGAGWTFTIASMVALLAAVLIFRNFSSNN